MSATLNQKQFITTQPLRRVMWILSLPAIAAMVLFGLNAFLDTVFVGQLIHETALSGVALAYPLTSVTMGFGSLAGTGAAAVLSVALGSEDENTQQKLLGNTTLIMLISSCLFAIPAYIFAEPLIQMMGGAGELLDYGVRYFRVTLLGAFFWVYGLGLNFIIRGEGKMKEAAIMMAYGLVANIILSPLFIIYFDANVEGAAWATNIGMLIYSLVGYLYFAQNKASFKANINQISYDPQVMRAILSQGFPGLILSMMSLLQAVVVFNALNNYGTPRDIAFFAAGNRIQLLLLTPLFGLMRALQPVIGINYGAKNIQRVKQSFYLFAQTGFFIIAPFWLLMTLFPTQALSLVLPNMIFTDQDICNFRVYVAMLPLLPLVFMGLTFFPAINQGKYGSILGLARQVIFYVPAMLLLPRYFGVPWIYYGATLIDVVITLGIVLLVRMLFRRMEKEV